ncbi:MAG: GC-type dockerin domain-anchored protein [Phycisphaerales bacterium]
MRGKSILVRVTAAVLAGFASIAIASDCSRTSVGLVPISDLGAGLYLGQYQGGLFPGGQNVPPAAHDLAGRNRAAGVTPLDVNGAPSPSGKYVLLSVGMSNTTQEFCCHAGTFMGRAAADPNVNHAALVIANGAAGGQSAATWDSPTDPNYDRVRDSVLAPQGLSEQQVQAVWVKVANPGPTVSLPAANADAFTLVTQMGNIVRSIRTRYPNVKQVFFSSRIYAGYASTTLNPEPYAYESGFAVKWLIEAQITQMSGGGISPLAGDLNPNTVGAWITWGPYLWADGLTPRSDGLTWACADFENDGTHPSPSGESKVGAALLGFFLDSPYTREWFRVTPCAADVNHDGAVTSQDFFLFIRAFFEQRPMADFNGDGAITSQDYFDYLVAFFTPCQA